jgi:hypothetical protein
MTLDLLLKLLRTHLAALQSSAWPRPHGPANGPAFYLDAADTRALITELAGIQRKLDNAGLGSPPIPRSERGAAGRVRKTAEDVAETETPTKALTPPETRTDELAREFGGEATVRSVP